MTSTSGVAFVAGLIVVGCACGVLGGCACGTDAETRNLMDVMPVAAITGNADQLAACIKQDVDAHEQIADGERAELRARGQVLAAHARMLGEAVRRYDASGKTNPSITLTNLRVRGAGLEAEYQAAFREWEIWQVRHGIKKPEEVVEVFDYSRVFEGKAGGE